MFLDRAPTRLPHPLYPHHSPRLLPFSSLSLRQTTIPSIQCTSRDGERQRQLQAHTSHRRSTEPSLAAPPLQSSSSLGTKAVHPIFPHGRMFTSKWLRAATCQHREECPLLKCSIKSWMTRHQAIRLGDEHLRHLALLLQAQQTAKAPNRRQLSIPTSAHRSIEAMDLAIEQTCRDQFPRRRPRSPLTD